MSTRQFRLQAVLYVTNGGDLPVGSTENLAEVQDLLTFMTGAPHRVAFGQIPRAADVCRKYLLDQHPWLADMAATRSQVNDGRRLQLWLKGWEKRRGCRCTDGQCPAHTVTVTATPGDAYTWQDPVVEWGRQMAART